MEEASNLEENDPICAAIPINPIEIFVKSIFVLEMLNCTFPCILMLLS